MIRKFMLMVMQGWEVDEARRIESSIVGTVNGCDLVTPLRRGILETVRIEGCFPSLLHVKDMVLADYLDVAMPHVRENAVVTWAMFFTSLPQPNGITR